MIRSYAPPPLCNCPACRLEHAMEVLRSGRISQAAELMDSLPAAIRGNGHTVCRRLYARLPDPPRSPRPAA